jgi:Sec7-like guanine-nucleotide exchange factor
MSIEEYQKNLRGVNDGDNFSPEFLVGVTRPVQLVEMN